jgi:phage terminase large subunit
MANPVEAVKDWFKVTPDDYQGDIINEMFLEGTERLVAKSGHGAGKSATLAWTGWLFLNFYPLSRLVATAPTFAQLNDVLWPEYARWHVQMPDMLGDQWYISGTHIRHKANPKVHFGVARTSNRPENLQGFHGSHIMVQCDEGSGVAPGVFEVIEGALSEAGQSHKVAKLIMMGNPNFTGGEFYNAFYKNKNLYSRFTLSGDPDLLYDLGLEQGDDHRDHGHTYFASRISEKYRENMLTKYGEGGVYDVRVRGLFPLMDDTAVIPLQWVEQALLLEPPRMDQIAHPVTLVMDVARFGGDETTLGAYRQGVPVKDIKAWAKTSTEQCVDILLDEKGYWDALGVNIQRIIVDEPGVGGGVVDTAKRRGLPITPYNGGETMKVNRDPDEDIRMFANRRSRDWWRVRRHFELGRVPLSVCAENEELVNQLASVKYDYNEREKILIESKRKMRDRLGDDASPDRADNLIMGLAPWYSFKDVNVVVSERDIIYGSDRPTAEMWW